MKILREHKFIWHKNKKQVAAGFVMGIFFPRTLSGIITGSSIIVRQHRSFHGFCTRRGFLNTSHLFHPDEGFKFWRNATLKICYNLTRKPFWGHNLNHHGFSELWHNVHHESLDMSSNQTRKKVNLQGVFFNWYPSKFSKYKMPCQRK